MLIKGMVDVLSMEASMLLNLWDGLHPEWGGWRYHESEFPYSWEEKQMWDEANFAPYVESWKSSFPRVGSGRKVIPLFQLAAELVVSRIFAPDTALGEAASWEPYESLWSPLGPVEPMEPGDYADEWVETLHGWEEIPREYPPPVPGGMSALRILAAFGDGKFAIEGQGGYRSAYVPFTVRRTLRIEKPFRFTGKRGEQICQALVGGRDFGVRSTWIRHLAMEVDSFGTWHHEETWESTPVLLFHAHLELAGQLSELLGSDRIPNWPFERPIEFGDDIDLSVDPF